MMGILTEQEVDNEQKLVELLKTNNFIDPSQTQLDSFFTESKFTKTSVSWIYINEKTKVYVYKKGDEYSFKRKKIYSPKENKEYGGVLKTFKTFPIPQDVISEYITNVKVIDTSENLKTLISKLDQLKKSWDNPEDYITYENGKLMYGTSTKKEVPSPLATSIKNGYKGTIKFVEDQIKNLPKEDKEKQVQSEFGNYNNILAYVDVVKKDAEELKLTS